MSSHPLRILSHFPLGLLAPLRERFPDIAVEVVPEEGALEPGLVGDVLLTQAWGSPNLGALLRCGVRWVHAYGTGVNAFPFAELGDVPLTCSRGASATPISEWVMAMLLAAEKRLPDVWIEEAPERWNRFDLGGLDGRTLGLLGFGGIARATAERALPFGMRVLAHRRSTQPSDLDGVEIVSFDALLAEADHLVVAAPYTPATRGLLGQDTFARIKEGVHLINVARGGLVDQDALRAALDSGRVALASLDTVTPEPLPAGHWLYTHPRVRLSPHCSWNGPGALDRLLDPFLENLTHFLNDEPLAYRVDVEQGY